MSEPEAGTRHSLGKWVKGFLAVLGGIAAAATILAFALDVQKNFRILDKVEYEELLELKARYERGEIIVKADSPAPEVPPPPSDPEVDRATILTAAIDELIQDAGFLAKYVEEPDFKDRFDKWRSNAKNKLTDGQKFISEAEWTSNEDWVGTFHAQTHIMRNVEQEPYRPEELRGFLESGSRILERMKREVILHSGNGIPSPGSSSLPEGES